MNGKSEAVDNVDGAIVSRVISLRREGHFRDALILVDELQKTEISQATAVCLNHLKAEMLQDEGRYWEAVLAYDDVLNNAPDAVAYANRGLAYLSLEDWERSLADYLLSLSIEPTDGVALQHTGEILIKLERYDEATRYLRRAHEINPESVSVLNSLGIAFHNAEDWMEAYRFLKMALRLDPGNEIATLGIRRMDEHLELNT